QHHKQEDPERREHRNHDTQRAPQHAVTIAPPKIALEPEYALRISLRTVTAAWTVLGRRRKGSPSESSAEGDRWGTRLVLGGAARAARSPSWLFYSARSVASWRCRLCWAEARTGQQPWHSQLSSE